MAFPAPNSQRSRVLIEGTLQFKRIVPRLGTTPGFHRRWRSAEDAMVAAMDRALATDREKPRHHQLFLGTGETLHA